MSGADQAIADDDYFVICAASDIPTGEARAFDLARLDEGGQSKPYRIVVVKNQTGECFGYVNACPHQGVWLNIGAGTFFDDAGALLKCGRHGAKFEIDSGKCVSGECEGAQLDQVPVAVIDGDVCIHGVALVEDDYIPPHWDDMDETMEIMIHPG